MEPMETNVRVVRFYHKAKILPDGKTENVEWLEYGPADDINNTRSNVTIRSIIPPAEFKHDNTGLKRLHMNAFWAAVQPNYTAWKNGEELPETGTPLGAWPALDSDQIAAFKAAGLKSIEDISGMSDTVIERVRMPGVRNLQTQARMFLENQDKAGLAHAVEAQDMKLAAMTATLEDTNQRLAAAMALLEEASKPKRGRPPKAQAA